MYAYIKGTVAYTTQTGAVIDVAGVGYDISCSEPFLYKLTSQVGKIVTIYTYLNVKEDEMSLFGFETIQEKNMFLNLISVNGIGPKLALSIIGGIKLNDLISAIVSGNSMIVNSVKGVGKKTAEKIIIELRDKISKSFDYDSSAVIGPKEELNDIMSDAIATLIALGYKEADAIKAVKAAYSDGISLTQLINRAMTRG
ncbi:MAG: Holliday junction branch migration protein RuvA [Clostridia bacterium]|nr:Holliday junction branch migration protein RuvA [Clostridia bacterium]MBP5648513.1 Holliday junction branch migration protein RuvA [Clostridia bacterium]